jgi:hypothetical protein
MNILSIAAKVSRMQGPRERKGILVNLTMSISQYPWRSTDLLASESEEQARVLRAIRGK